MKKGFTLIEVLVVVVILGVLAAIAVPKLFGNVAKAKASEIPAAASTYKHVQDAYLGANAVLGNWSQIGYDAPGGGATENFCYSQGNLNDTMSVSRTEGGVIGWGATNTVGLTNCTRPSWWSIVISPEGNSVKYEQNVSLNECVSLVLGWKLGTTLTGGCESPAVNQREPAPETQNPETPVSPESPSETTQPSTPTEEKQESPQTPPSKEVNMDEYYTYTNGVYKKCNTNSDGSDGGDSWLNGNKNGSDCKPLRDLLYDNGDLVLTDKGNNNHYDYKDENTRCLVTKNCSDDDYSKALDAKRAEEEAKKAAEEEAKRKAEEEAAAAANSSSSAMQCKDKSGKTCDCSKGGKNCKPVP